MKKHAKKEKKNESDHGSFQYSFSLEYSFLAPWLYLHQTHKLLEIRDWKVSGVVTQTFALEIPTLVVKAKLDG